ncbi:transcription cofactor vestigial-like protein 4b isoform X2 [Periophthalmus magnuspinnatus]|uniref:transcription cofactor vestigial-like protein 4b isoform X2 n=1 Tax=Periophthalmus magnuspinnatus TaxID=409849 RepID=UPI00145C0F08|nr:transcription cofactor vestigial-like protein 4b isoform X2 [Periophthalmus magnuspinnatus]
METPLDVLSRAASFVHANEEESEGALRADPRLQALSLSSTSSISNHRTGPPPISPTKRKLSGDHGDSDIDDNEHVAKMSRLFAAQLKPNGDYRSSKDSRSRSPPERLVMPSALSVHSNHLYAPHPHPHHLPLSAPLSALSLEQPLALTKNNHENSRGSNVVPHTVVERQQNRPSVITCAPANNRNCNLSHCPVSHNGCSNLSNNFRRINTNTVCDPVIEEHFRRSLGKNYKEPEPATATNTVSITGSVDDHFAKALGDTWLQIKNKSSPSSSGSSPNSSPDTHSANHNHSPSVVS